jgi:energy-coupling factor transporter ATP-binding protein EcfA2
VSMGVLLHQRGIFTLHASASLIHGTVSAFIGVKGAGKSTLAAALHGAGHPLISDDLVALGVAFDSRRVAVDPGVPQLKLWPDAVEAAMAHSPEDLPRLYAPSPKRLLPMQHRPAGERLDLGSVFVLEWHSDDASEPAVERASSEGAFLALTQHAYPLRFLGKDAVTANHLRQCTHIASHVPVYLLRRPRGLDRLPDVVDCVGWATAGST